MTNEKAIELLKNAVPAKALPDDEIGFLIEAVNMAIKALEKAPTALDHIHNVVAEREYQRGYKQAKEEYDHKLTVIKSRIKDHYYNKGYEQGKADANCPEIPDSCNAETVEAIPVPWIEAEIKKLRDLDFEFATMTAGQIEAMLNKWRKEQNNGIDKS